MKFLAIILPVVLLLPAVALAQAGNMGTITGFINNIVSFMNNVLVPAIFAVAFLVFLWGMFKTFILGGSDPDKQAEGKSLMVYAIVGFVIMVSLWGIVNLVARGFGFQNQQIQDIPDLPTGQN